MSAADPGDILAALDLGTTNCRLLIARPGGYASPRIIDSFSRIVRLGEGLDATGLLSDAAMDRTIDALTICASKIRLRHVTRGRYVATEACRRAQNGAVFLDRVRAAVGFDLEVVSTDEEARLALAGCLPLLDPSRPDAVVFDIGGGSTEIMWVGVRQRHDGRPTAKIRGVLSVPHGVVSLTEHFQTHPDCPETFQRMTGLLRERFADFDRAFGIRSRIAAGTVQMLGSSGTVTTLAGMQLGLPRYDRSRVDGTWLDFAAIERACAYLAGAGASSRALEPCIGPGRADLMVAGCAILSAICDTWPVGRLRVADRGVREGILAGLQMALRADTHRSLPPTSVTAVG